MPHTATAAPFLSHDRIFPPNHAESLRMAYQKYCADSDLESLRDAYERYLAREEKRSNPVPMVQLIARGLESFNLFPNHSHKRQASALRIKSDTDVVKDAWAIAGACLTFAIVKHIIEDAHKK